MHFILKKWSIRWTRWRSWYLLQICHNWSGAERIQPASIELWKNLILIMGVQFLYSVEINGWILEDDRCVLVAAVSNTTVSVVLLLVHGLLFVCITTRRLRLLASNIVRWCWMLLSQHRCESLLHVSFSYSLLKCHLFRSCNCDPWIDILDAGSCLHLLGCHVCIGWFFL